MKKGLIVGILLSLVSLVSAYGESSGILIGSYYLDIDLIASVAIFMTLFVLITFATRKAHFPHTEGARIFISFVLAMFSIYGLSKANISYQELFIDWGLQNFLMQYIAWIILGFCVIIILVYNIKTLILILSAAFIAMGFTGMYSETIVYNWELSMMIGILLLLVYLWIKKKSGSSTKFKATKTEITQGMARLDIITPAGEVKYANQRIIKLALPYGEKVKVYIRNGGEKRMQWKAQLGRGLRVSKSRGILEKNMHSLMIVKKVSDTADILEVIVYARGEGDKNRETQMAKIQIYPTDKPQKKEEGPKGPSVNPPQQKQQGLAIFGLKVGGSTYNNAAAKTINVKGKEFNETKIEIMNTGKGEELYWTRRLDSETGSNKSRGRIKPGRSEVVKVMIKKTDAKQKTIIIYAKDRNTKGWQQATINIDLDQEEKKKIEKKTRTAKELQEKYDYYSKQVKKIMKQNNGVIPGIDKTNPTLDDGWRRHRFIQAMITIEKMAEQQGVQLKYYKWYEPAMQKGQKALKKQLEGSKEKAKNLMNKFRGK